LRVSIYSRFVTRTYVLINFCKEV